jgi:signal transduction histidine kinase
MDDFPAVLTTWAPDGRMLARLDLAKLDLSEELLQVQAASARDSGLSTEERAVLPPTVFVRNVPFPDGSVVSVAVGPISRLIEPVRLGRFLRGERRLVVPYEMSLGRPITESEAAHGTVWERSGWVVRGLGSMRPIEEFYYRVHVHVSLGSLGGTLLRGVLVCFWSLFFIGGLWLVGEAVAGSLAIGPISHWSLWFRSYRIRLAIALASFFILPTIAFAAWSIVRVRMTAATSGDLIIQETLSDAANSARFYAALTSDTLQARLTRLAEQLNADLLWYHDGVLQHASPSALVELGMVDRYLPPGVYRRLVIDAEPRATVEEVVGGHATRVGFHSLSALGAVLAAPRLVDVRDIQSGREDLLFGLLLAALLGLAAASKLAAVAARSLAKPVRSLRGAALAVGRGDPLPGFEPDAPVEFVPVFEAFERMARDIEASQSALEAARRRTADVLRNVATAVVALDRNLCVTIANPRAELLLGTDLAAGLRIDVVAGPEWKPVWDWLIEFLRRGYESDSEEFTVAASQIRAQVAAIRGQPGGCVLALDDTTELTRAVRILAWGELARQIAHEIKNPLTPIRLGIQHLSRAHGDGRDDFGETLDRTARQILAEIERLDAIARAFSRFGAPPAEAEPPSRTDVTAIAAETVELYRLGEGTAVSMDAPGPLMAWVRKDEVKEVLVNLIENARDAGAVEVQVTVATDAEGDVLIEVADDGRGIPTKEIPLIFEPHFSTTTSGAGLGLAICKRLVESWGGTITVESKSHVGTTVSIRIEQEGEER